MRVDGWAGGHVRVRVACVNCTYRASLKAGRTCAHLP